MEVPRIGEVQPNGSCSVGCGLRARWHRCHGVTVYLSGQWGCSEIAEGHRLGHRQLAPSAMLMMVLVLSLLCMRCCS